MAKKRNNQTTLLFTLLIIVFGLVSFCMMFTDLLKVEANDSASLYKGLDVIFGRSTQILTVTTTFEFSILGFLAYVLPLIAVIIILALFNKRMKVKYLIAAVLFIVSIILIIQMPSYTKCVVTGMFVSGTYTPDFKLNITAIFAAVSSGLGALSSLVAFINK